MQAYLNLLRRVYEQGTDREDRTGVGTRSLFGVQLRCPLQAGFPLLTTKKVHLKSVICELLWFLSGSTNVRDLHEHGVTIWDEWADADGELGPIYGKQWRAWAAPDGRHIDQLTQALDLIRRDPNSRRIVVSAWNPADLDAMALPPCHALFQFYVAGGALSCQIYQRSCDLFLGVPFNLASYALLTMMIALDCGLTPGDLVWTGGDAHIYRNHFAQVALQLTRSPRALPRMQIRRAASLFDYRYEDFTLVNYDPWPAIKAPIAV